MRVCTSCRRLLPTDRSRCPADGGAGADVAVLPPGTLLDAYRIDGLLGEGGMGFVYSAVHEVLERRCAIKMLRPELSQHDQILTRFLNEAKAVNLINHDNIVNVYSYGDWGPGSAYFVMEYLQGETLEDLMLRQVPMPLPLLLHVFGQIAKALSAAHAKRIVHRDLKPGNVYVVAREDNPHFVKLLDFGIAQLRGAGAVQHTMAGSVLGTPQYMSPEQIGGGSVDARTDVWAMGVMMYRAATGRAPFEGEEFVELADQILHRSPPPPHQIAPVAMELSRLIEHCLTRQLDQRCQSIDQLIAGIRRVKREAGLEDDTILGVAEVAPPERGLQPSVKPARSHTLRYALISAALAALAMFAYTMHARPSAPRPPIDGRPPTGPTPVTDVTIEALVAAGDTARARARAEQALRDAVGSPTLQQQGVAVDALGATRMVAGAPLLYAALAGSPEVRVKAAHALGELALPDAAPKLRAALAASGDRLKVELAAVLFKLGDKDARAILTRATEEPALRLTAAAALADAGDDAGRPALVDALEGPPGRESWRRAAHALVKLGDAGTRKRLEAELALPDAARVVGAAAILAEAGDAKAREQLARAAADPGFARPGEASVALARLGDRRALDWVDRGLASADADERRQALEVCALVTSGIAPHRAAIAKLATDADLRVRMTAEAVLLGL